LSSSTRRMVRDVMLYLSAFLWKVRELALLASPPMDLAKRIVAWREYGGRI